MIMTFLSRFKTIIIILSFCTLAVSSWAHVADQADRYDSLNKAGKEAIKTSQLTTREETGINFEEWDRDFDKSLDKAPSDCKGSNCKFKNRQAFESSFDF